MAVRQRHDERDRAGVTENRRYRDVAFCAADVPFPAQGTQIKETDDASSNE
jgi:hypothetical protein